MPGVGRADLLQEKHTGAVMEEQLAIIGYASLALGAGIVISLIINHRTRRFKASVLQELHDHRVPVIRLDVAVIHVSRALLNLRIQWQKGEALISEHSVIFFRYFSLFGVRVYQGAIHWYLQGAKLPAPLSSSNLIETLSIEGQDLVISSSRERAVVRATFSSRFLGIGRSDQFDIIKQMLKLV